MIKRVALVNYPCKFGYCLSPKTVSQLENTSPILASLRKVESEGWVDKDNVDEIVIGTVPENVQVNSKNIMRVSRSHGGDLVS